MSELEDVFEVAAAFHSFKAPWWIAGGWAIDLHLGRVSRAHHDIDVLVLRRDQMLLHPALAGFELKKIVPHPEGLSGRGTIADWKPSERDGQRDAGRIRWREGTITEWEAPERLELPIHQVNAYPVGKSEMSFQIMFGESDGAEWWYRRDARIRRRLDAIGCKGQQDTPYLAPEIMLLFKAKTMRSYDQNDFETVLPMLTQEARGWLSAALAIAHPNHPWIARLN